MKEAEYWRSGTDLSCRVVSIPDPRLCYLTLPFSEEVRCQLCSVSALVRSCTFDSERLQGVVCPVSPCWPVSVESEEEVWKFRSTAQSKDPLD